MESNRIMLSDRIPADRKSFVYHTENSGKELLRCRRRKALMNRERNGR